MYSDFYHDSRDLQFRRPFGAVPCGTAVQLSLTARGDTLPNSICLRAWSTALGEQVVAAQTVVREDGVCRYQFCLTASLTPGLIWYHFVLGYAERTLWFGAPADGLGGQGGEYHGIPTDWQITVYDAATQVPDWYTEGIMYQIFPDRFCRGDQSLAVPRLPVGGVYHPRWQDWPFYAKDPHTGDIASYDFFGGTLEGIAEKLDYLKSLGVTMVYLNPIFKSVSNHKYDTGDYLAVDDQFGGNRGFENLQAVAKAKGIRIIFDGVFSHNGIDSEYFQSAIRSQDSPYYPWYRFSKYPDKYDCWWGVTTMPNVNEMEPSYRKFIINGTDSVIKHWLKRGVNGWRLDVVDELPGEFVQELYRELKATDPDAVLIGEVWEDASRKESYGSLRQYLWGHELDSVINYPFRAAILDFLLGVRDAASACRQLASLSENYPTPYFYSTMNVLGSHDVPRALTLLGEAPPESGLTKLEQARYTLPPTARIKAVARLKLAALIQFASPGVPCIYYGDEAGIEGHSDPQNRRTYPWGGEQTELIDWYQRLGQLRQNEPVLRTGHWRPLSAGPDIFAFGRYTVDGKDALGNLMTDTAMLILVNRRGEPVDCAVNIASICGGPMKEVFPGTESLHFPDGNGLLKLKLPEWSALVLKAGVHEIFSGRQAGILLHPTSLPGPYGIGDLGPSAHAFVDWLSEAKQQVWQILPLTPVDSTGSPYQSASAFAGNSLLISPEELVRQGLLIKSELPAGLSEVRVEYGTVTELKNKLLQLAFERFRQQETPESYRKFCDDAADWLEDYALFMALKKHHGGVAWTEWEPGAARRKPSALRHYQQDLGVEIEFHRFVQFLFYQQWDQLHQHAKSKKIRIVGDLPIFVSHDSADVWAHPRLFSLDSHGRPKTLAGVPPDYFSSTGQLWGNPHYNWQRHAEEDYDWWVRRLQWLFKAVDAIRIDHFRGFEAFWEIPARAKNAVRGKWVKGPAEHFFNSLWRQLGPMPIIAEDLGVITPEVVKLKESFFLPGMVILQFEIWPEKETFHLPEPSPNSFYYTGTHDNDTLLGWLKFVRASEPELFSGALLYAGAKSAVSPAKLVRPLVDRLLQSVARLAVVPVQDWLALDTKSRMNMPSTAAGNWSWRLTGAELTAELAGQIRALTEKSGRG